MRDKSPAANVVFDADVARTVMFAVPGVKAVTTPLFETVATAVLLLV
jgi:hypothetical protein